MGLRSRQDRLGRRHGPDPRPLPPPRPPRALGVAAVVALAAVNLLGVKKTALASALFAFATIAVLAAVVIAGATGPAAVQGAERTDPWGC
ncbi:hypothetical protein GCM10029992_03950 [Glycomyces albus]